jgi:hypothetical protein
VIKKPKVTPQLQINVRLPPDVIDALGDFCENTGIRQKAVVELAIRRFLHVENERMKVDTASHLS